MTFSLKAVTVRMREMNTDFEDIFKAKNELIKEQINKDDLLSDLEVSSLLAKSSVPYSHRRIASKYNVLRSICSFQIVQPRITNTEKNLLSKYSMNVLENSTITTVNKELLALKNWAISSDDRLRDESVDLLNIRVKELKFILSNNYSAQSNELLKGYRAIEVYLTSISKYYN